MKLKSYYVASICDISQIEKVCKYSNPFNYSIQPWWKSLSSTAFDTITDLTTLQQEHNHDHWVGYQIPNLLFGLFWLAKFQISALFILISICFFEKFANLWLTDQIHHLKSKQAKQKVPDFGIPPCVMVCLYTWYIVCLFVVRPSSHWRSRTRVFYGHISGYQWY